MSDRKRPQRSVIDVKEYVKKETRKAQLSMNSDGSWVASQEIKKNLDTKIAIMVRYYLSL